MTNIVICEICSTLICPRVVCKLVRHVTNEYIVESRLAFL